MGKLTAAIRVADEVWIATALLHREHPGAADFSLKEIEARLAREGLTDDKRPGVYPHLGPLRRQSLARWRSLPHVVRNRAFAPALVSAG